MDVQPQTLQRVDVDVLVSNHFFWVAPDWWVPSMVGQGDPLSGPDRDGLTVFTGVWGGRVSVTLERCVGDPAYELGDAEIAVLRPFEAAVDEFRSLGAGTPDLLVSSIDDGTRVHDFPTTGLQSVLIAARGRQRQYDQAVDVSHEHFLVRYSPLPCETAVVLFDRETGDPDDLSGASAAT